MTSDGANMSKYLLDGDIRETELPVLVQALAGPEWTVTDRGDELEIEADGVVIDIYDHASDRVGRQFLISGQLERDPAAVKALLATLSSRLRARGIQHRLELGDDQGNDIETTRFLGAGND
jgi:hypothetical protein